jgi:uncharacterized repeat protein (TIGR03809 family)
MLSRRVESSRLGLRPSLFAGWYMTHRNGVADGRDLGIDLGIDLGPRWRLLAERRLEHLTELFESGRWRRYYSERAFLENIQEAKAAVALWRDLSMPQAIDGAARVQAARPNGAAMTPAAKPAAMAPAAPIIVQAKAVIDLTGAASAATSDEMLPAPAPTPPATDEKATTASNATEARFALLRNML